LGKAPYYIVIRRTNQVLLSFLKIRVVINNKDIYPLQNDQPVIIPVDINYPRIVVTDGFHFTKPLELVYEEPSYYRFNVACAINDLQLLGGAFFLVLFYLLGFLTGLFFLKLVSFVPIILFLFVYYINRKEFIRIIPVRSSQTGIIR
jgi:hypothetical protein